jgi:glycosyltransferase involved in cell wall biosynthesis
MIEARRRLRRLLEERRPDVVACHSAWPLAVCGPVVKGAGRLLVFWMHDLSEGKHWVERWAKRTSPDLAIVNSHYTATTLPNLFPDAPHEVIYCPVEAPAAHRDRAEVRRELDTPDDATVIIQASRLERWKGQGPLIEALGRLRDRRDWMAWVVGGAQRPHEASYLDELRAACRAAGIADRVRFLGQRRDVPRLLAAADVHCQPNTGPEPFGIAFVEALYAGLPVVTTAFGGAVEVVDEACGLLVPPGGAGAIASALAALLDDPTLRARLGAAGPGRAAMLCDPSTILAQLHDHLAALVAAPAIGGRRR